MSSIPPDHYERVKEIILKLNDPEVLLRHLEQGGTFQTVLSLTDEEMDSLYENASTLLREGEYSNAADAFLCLTTLNPYVSHYWIGLGLAEQAHRACHAALVAYARAIICDENNPAPYYYAASCHYLNNDLNEALHSLEIALSKAQGHPAYTEIYSRALASQAILLNKKRASPQDPEDLSEESSEDSLDDLT